MSTSTFVLVPGAGGVAAYWGLVVAELQRRGHDAVAVDLAGEDESAGLSEYVDAVLAAADGKTNVVFVGQSLGGFSASLAAARTQGSRLVLLNAMIPAPGETPGEWWEATGFAEAKRANDIREGRDPDAELDLNIYFFHDTPPELMDEVSRTGRPESEAVFAEPWPLTAWPDVPTTVIAGRDDRFFPLEFQTRLARERLGLEPRMVPGGHLAALSHPAELADLLVEA